MTPTPHWFGLLPAVDPLPALYWGGRALYYPYPDQGIELLWDRQQCNKNDDTKSTKSLLVWVTSKGLLHLKKELARLSINASDDALVMVLDRKYTIVANPKKSHGYIYIGAW